jgi:aryl-alcohol dehydrogenase-like predicted oxidoreductase
MMPSLARRKLGSSGPEITTVGFGAWAVGGPYRFGWGPQDDDESIAAIRHAVESGVNWIDTAAVYGIGHSEEVVGRALEPYDVGEDVLVATKCGRKWVGSRASGGLVFDLRPESIRQECEDSLRRLGLDTIDLYQFHWPDTETGTPIEDSWATMLELVEEGKVRWAGVSNFDVALLERCEAMRHVDSLQPPYSMIDSAARAELIPWCRAHGVGVVVYSPMASGLLTGKFDRDAADRLADGDWRRNSPQFRDPKLSRNLELVERLRPIAARLGVGLPVVTVAWTLATPGVTAAVVGARSPRQVDGWLPAAGLALDDDTMAEIERALEETVAAPA